jgi:hypothetical protein
VLDIQNALRGTDLGPAADSLDILIAGYAIANDAAVMTADHDLAHIATVTDLIHEYIAPLAVASAVVMFSGPGSVVP